MSNKNLGLEWAAGFFEGEGNAYVRPHKKRGKFYPSFVLQIAQVHREPLDAFKDIVGIGAVRGPYGPYSGNRQPHYQYNVSGQVAVPVAEKLIPLMFHKGEQTQEALTKYMEYWNGRK